jgi:hypothetical protein
MMNTFINSKKRLFKSGKKRIGADLFYAGKPPIGPTVNTGQGAFRTTFSATLPIRAWERPVRPWVAMTIRSAFFLWQPQYRLKDSNVQYEHEHRGINIC